MLDTPKITAGSPFPSLPATDLEGRVTDLAVSGKDADWRMVIVYRGVHCPLCTRYLNAFAGYRERLAAIGVDLAAVSGDSAVQLQRHTEKLTEVNFPLYHGLSLEQMKSLGLYISYPRSEKETDHPFAEPGLFVINAEGTVQVVDISNNPFVRPDLERLVSGLEWIRKNTYPIRGTYPYTE